MHFDFFTVHGNNPIINTQLLYMHFVERSSIIALNCQKGFLKEII